MSIRLVSISHKTAPLEVRELFAFTKEQQEELMRTLISEGRAAESVVISTSTGQRSTPIMRTRTDRERICLPCSSS